MVAQRLDRVWNFRSLGGVRMAVTVTGRASLVILFADASSKNRSARRQNLRYIFLPRAGDVY